ncbi:MAG: hypothetical protein ACI3W7_04825 [Oscillospiraceae bacterium]
MNRSTCFDGIHNNGYDNTTAGWLCLCIVTGGRPGSAIQVGNEAR